MALDYSWAQFISRLERHFNNNFPSQDFKVSKNEMLLYINEAMSFGIVGQVWNGAKATGIMEMPEAYLVTFELAALQQDSVTSKWYSTLPQPPLSLPLGYSITRIYFADGVNGEGVDCNLIKAKRVGRRKNMPIQYGVNVSIENSRVLFQASDGSSLYGKTAYVNMPSTRAVSVSDPINLPDDAQKVIFDLVMIRLKERLGIPQDIIQNDLPSGNKNS